MRSNFIILSVPLLFAFSRFTFSLIKGPRLGLNTMNETQLYTSNVLLSIISPERLKRFLKTFSLISETII